MRSPPHNFVTTGGMLLISSILHVFSPLINYNLRVFSLRWGQLYETQREATEFTWDPWDKQVHPPPITKMPFWVALPLQWGWHGPSRAFLLPPVRGPKNKQTLDLNKRKVPYIYIYIFKEICRKPISQHPGLATSLYYLGGALAGWQKSFTRFGSKSSRWKQCWHLSMFGQFWKCCHDFTIGHNDDFDVVFHPAHSSFA